MISVLQMTRVVFGDGPSPCLAIATLRRTADDYGADYEEAKKAIMNNLYVDDYLDSAPTLDIANKRAAKVADILTNGDFNL
jgi:hypothetical protein